MFYFERRKLCVHKINFSAPVKKDLIFYSYTLYQNSDEDILLVKPKRYK